MKIPVINKNILSWIVGILVVLGVMRVLNFIFGIVSAIFRFMSLRATDPSYKIISDLWISLAFMFIVSIVIVIVSAPKNTKKR